jgi:uncharacterized protein YpmB
MQSDLTTSAKLLKLIDWERRKNRWTIVIVITLLSLTILGLIIYQFWPEDSGYSDSSANAVNNNNGGNND